MKASKGLKNSTKYGISEQEPFVNEFYFYLLIHAHALLSKRVDLFTSKEKVSRNEFKVLLTMVGNPGISLGHLAETMQVKQSTLSRIVDPMVDNGLIKREPAQGNRRALELNLTKKGCTKAAPLLDHGAELNCCVEEILGTKDSKHLKRILKRIINHERNVNLNCLMRAH